MTYKSKLAYPIKMEEEKLQKKKEEIMEITAVRNQIQSMIEREKEKFNMIRDSLAKGGSSTSSFLGVGFNRFYVYELEFKLDEQEELLRDKNREYLQIKKKLEKMIELDKQREKEYEKQIEKKEQREMEELHGFLKDMRGRGKK